MTVRVTGGLVMAVATAAVLPVSAANGQEPDQKANCDWCYDCTDGGVIRHAFGGCPEGWTQIGIQHMHCGFVDGCHTELGPQECYLSHDPCPILANAAVDSLLAAIKGHDVVAVSRILDAYRGKLQYRSERGRLDVLSRSGVVRATVPVGPGFVGLLFTDTRDW